MKISRIILKGVNNFEDFDYSFEDEWTQSIPDSLLLLGPNGSGKTTILRSIASLWDVFGELIEGTDPFLIMKRFEDKTLGYCRLATVKIEQFLADSKPIWLYVGQEEQVNSEIRTKQKDSYKIGLAWRTDTNKKSISNHFIIPAGNSETDAVQMAELTLKNLRDRFIKNRLGGVYDLPNLVFLESEERNLYKIAEDTFSVVPEPETFNWLSRYAATTRREGSIENYLFTLKAIRPDDYEYIVEKANGFLSGKQISGFNEKTGKLLVTTDTGQTHPIHLLSSGEKQVLLMIAYIARELRPGGIVLIDEPDLHLHVSLSTAFVSYLKRMVTEQEGQLIIASHAPELWDRFTDAEKVRLGAALEVGG